VIRREEGGETKGRIPWETPTQREKTGRHYWGERSYSFQRGRNDQGSAAERREETALEEEKGITAWTQYSQSHRRALARQEGKERETEVEKGGGGEETSSRGEKGWSKKKEESRGIITT